MGLATRLHKLSRAISFPVSPLAVRERAVQIRQSLPMPLPRERFLDELATAYVQAVAAAAGMTIAVSWQDYGVDGSLSHIVRARKQRARGDKFIPEGFAVEFQLKGTTVATLRNDHILYDLNARNYDLIAGRSPFGTPLYLFLVCFDSEMENWMAIERERLILRASAYWWKRTSPPTINSSKVRIRISVLSRLTSEAVREMLQLSKQRFGL